MFPLGATTPWFWKTGQRRRPMEKLGHVAILFCEMMRVIARTAEAECFVDQIRSREQSTQPQRRRLDECAEKSRAPLAKIDDDLAICGAVVARLRNDEKAASGTAEIPFDHHKCAAPGGDRDFHFAADDRS